jgi:hypothetical protein
MEAFFAQRFDDEFSDKWIVLDDEYAHRRLLNILISDQNLERPNLRKVPLGTQRRRE